MADISAHTPSLHLVGGDQPATTRRWAEHTEAREAVARANIDSAGQRAPGDLDPADPRWVFAVRTSTQLQGDVLTPERRRRLMRLATTLGLRPFDANVIIAIVQDQVRRSGGLADAASTLQLVPGPHEDREADAHAAARRRWIAAILCAAAANAFLIWWVIGG